MNDNYKIIDTRLSESFKTITFSGYKKTEVYKILFKSIESGKIENACNWATECICSGYMNELWQKLIIYCCISISINNPTLYNFLYKKNIYFNNIINNIDKKDRYSNLNLRNDQNIRNLFFSIVTIATMSSKTKRYDKYPKLKDEDFVFDNIFKRFKAIANIIPDDLIHLNEPEELKLVSNEIFTYFKNNNYDNSLYWVIWFFEWEKRNIKAKHNWNIDSRDIDVDNKFKNDSVWIIWNLILLECEYKTDNIKLQIKSLYELYKSEYTSRKKSKRISLIYTCICFLTNEINWNTPLINDNSIYIQTNINNNNMFKIKKIHENRDKIKDVGIDLKLLPEIKFDKRMISEKCMDKLKIFNDLDHLNSK